MSSKTLVVPGVPVAIVGGIIMRHQPEPAPTIYLMDARFDSSMPLEQALRPINRLARIDGAKVDVRAAATVSQLGDYRSMIEEFERTREWSRLRRYSFRWTSRTGLNGRASGRCWLFTTARFKDSRNASK